MNCNCSKGRGQQPAMRNFSRFSRQEAFTCAMSKLSHSSGMCTLFASLQSSSPTSGAFTSPITPPCTLVNVQPHSSTYSPMA